MHPKIWFLGALGSLGLAASLAPAQTVPPVPVPAANPITEPKRILGKILFWDEQLSSDNTVSCATCHQFNVGGADPRRARNPGLDGLVNTPDDVFGSPGVVKSTAAGDFDKDAVFALLPQITGRAANSPINAGYSIDSFWDGRARSQFIDPQTGQVAIPAGGGLESQVVAPPVNSVEMAHADRDWNAVAAKLASSRPMALATGLPADVDAALRSRPTYASLFAKAFGDGEITARRIAFAIATYERTLVSNDTPWDRFIAGQPNAMTPGQIQGWQAFQASNCIVCHAAPMFSDQSFRNIGLRPIIEDNGRQAVTGNAADRGRFKVPSLRNAGLRTGFMHNGQFTNIGQVIGFYARAPGAPQQFPDNRDPIMLQVNVPPQVAPAMQDFVTNALTDARVTTGQFPFDRATLYTQRPADQPINLGGGTSGQGGIVPTMIANAPPFIGNADFRLGLDRARGGATARIAMSSTPPVGGAIPRTTLFGPFPVSGVGAGNGFATFHWPIVPGSVSRNQTVYFQWIVDDPSGAGGEALSSVTQVRFFCGSVGCPPACPADWDGSGSLTTVDIAAFVNDWTFGIGSGIPLGDFDGNGVLEPGDIAAFVRAWFDGLTSGC
ncbi:MAG: hypothetical protein KF745_08650 [Phycisphaeraceae bacterium]|nr:hypothetical protein [Phycisphaeraceae bacterium]